MKIFAHRGYSSLYPENTMTAFIKAEGTKPDGIELDIQMTKDGEVVIIHDEKVDRTTNGSGRVRDFTFRELQGLNANKTHPNACKKEHIPSFEEYCEWLESVNLMTNVEIKTGIIYYPDIEKKALKMIGKYGVEKKIFFSSFNPLSIVLIKKIAPSFKCGLLVENPIENAGALCAASGFEYYHPGIHFATREAVRECHDKGIEVNIWTANKKKDIEHLKELKADGFFSNYPQISSFNAEARN